MLKARRRPDVKSNIYYINGTFNYEGQTKVIKNISAKTDKLGEANKFIYRLIEQLKQDINFTKTFKFKDIAEIKKQDTDNPPSLKTIRLIDKVVTYLGEYDVRNITNQLIKEKAFECYPLEDYLKQSAYSDLNENDKKRKSARLNTINRSFICPTSLIINYANQQKMCNKMVIPRMQLIKRDPIFFTVKEVEKCLQTSTLFQIKLLLVFLIYTGARLQEALNTKWEDIDLNKPEIKLWESKGDKSRTVTIHKNLLEWLKKVNDRGRYIFIWRKAWDNKKDGEGLYFNWRDMLRQADISFEKTPHKCRHTFATWLRAYAGCDTEDLKDIGGWKDSKSVAVYSHIMPQTMPKKINLLP
jgi:integrase